MKAKPTPAVRGTKAAIGKLSRFLNSKRESKISKHRTARRIPGAARNSEQVRPSLKPESQRSKRTTQVPPI